MAIKGRTETDSAVHELVGQQHHFKSILSAPVGY